MNRSLVLAAIPLVVFGCAHRSRSTQPGAPAMMNAAKKPAETLRLVYDSRRVAVGDLVMVNAFAENVTDEHAYIEWDAAPADIRTQENGRTAFLTFKNPGKYTVTARLIIDEHTAKERSVTFDVEPGRWPRPGRT